MNTNSNLKTLEQARAEWAWGCIQKIANKSPEIKKKYGSLARKVPMLVLTNGLGQTLAFLKSKGKDQEEDAHTILLCHLSEWVLRRLGVPESWRGDLLKWVLRQDSNSTTYRHATLEALAFLNWLKRFAEAELPEE